MPRKNLMLENVRLFGRNFSGLEGKYNRAGQRMFNVILPLELGKALEEEGYWTTLKWLAPRNEDEDPAPFLKVAVNYKVKANQEPPKIVMITSKGKTTLTEDMVSLLDWAEASNIDMVLSPYEWDVDGKTGVKPYLKSLYVTIVENEVDLKYADVPEIESTLSKLYEIEEEDE